MDDLGRGGDDGSLATGNAGARCLENTICDKKRQHLRQKYKKKWDTNTLRAACLKILIETKIQKTIETEIFSGLPAASSRRWKPPPPGNQRRASTLYRERSKNKFTETRYFLSLKSYAFEVLFSLFPLLKLKFPNKNKCLRIWPYCLWVWMGIFTGFVLKKKKCEKIHCLRMCLLIMLCSECMGVFFFKYI